jgi:hypothetical protein
MKFSTEIKKQIVEGFIDIFTRIASKEYQKRTWIKGEGPDVDDFDDTVNDFFGECDYILENYKDFGLTDKQYQLLANFRDMFDAFVIESRPISISPLYRYPRVGKNHGSGKKSLASLQLPEILIT